MVNAVYTFGWALAITYNMIYTNMTTDINMTYTKSTLI